MSGCGSIAHATKEAWMDCAESNVKNYKVAGGIVIVVTLLLTILIIAGGIKAKNTGSIIFGLIMLAVGGGIGYYLYSRDPATIKDKARLKAGVRWETVQNRRKADLARIENQAGGARREDETEMEYQNRMRLARELQVSRKKQADAERHARNAHLAAATLYGPRYGPRYRPQHQTYGYNRPRSRSPPPRYRSSPRPRSRSPPRRGRSPTRRR